MKNKYLLLFLILLISTTITAQNFIPVNKIEIEESKKSELSKILKAYQTLSIKVQDTKEFLRKHAGGAKVNKNLVST